MKIALIMCNDMHADLEKANILLAKIPNSDITTDYTIADVIIIYACAFGSNKSYSVKVIADVRMNAKSDAKVIVTGCLAQVFRKDLEYIPNIQVKSFGELLKCFEKKDETTSKSIRQNTVIISEGCLYKCSYCVYPKVCGGKYKSKPIEQIIDEVRVLNETESTICISGAQETSEYGVDLYKKPQISRLMAQIAEEFPNTKFIIGWYNPSRLGNIVQTIINHDNISEIMLHIEHNDPEILRKMNRSYDIVSISDYLRILREKRPDLIISTEVIVGFPGETDEKFDNLVLYLSQGYFDDIAVASYEKVEGTNAAKMNDQVPKEVANKRMEVIQKRFNATCYPAPSAEEESETINDIYLKAYYLLKGMPKKVLNNEAMQKYSNIAGVDTKSKLEFEKEFEKIVSIISNARDELASKRAKKYLTTVYTKEILTFANEIIQGGAFKPGFKSKAKNILIE